MKSLSFKNVFALLLFATIAWSVTSCSEDAVKGCTDSASTNYNSAATEDNGSCIYARDAFLGNYRGELACPGDLAILSVDTITFSIVEGIDNIETVSVVFTNSALSGLTFDATIVNSELIIDQMINGVPITISGFTGAADITGVGSFTMSENDTKMSGPLAIEAIIAPPISQTLSDNCTIVGTKL